MLTDWFWYVGTLVPVIGLVAVGGQSMADRYAYLPSVGVLILLAWGAHDLTRHWRYRVPVFSCAAAGVVLGCMVLTRENIGCWKNTETLFRHAIASTRNNHKAHGVLGSLLLEQGRVDEAIIHFREVERLKPDAWPGSLTIAWVSPWPSGGASMRRSSIFEKPQGWIATMTPRGATWKPRKNGWGDDFVNRYIIESLSQEASEDFRLHQLPKAISRKAGPRCLASRFRHGWISIAANTLFWGTTRLSILKVGLQARGRQ